MNRFNSFGGCGSVGWAVAPETRCQQFVSHQLNRTAFSCCNPLISKIKSQWGLVEPFLKRPASTVFSCKSDVPGFESLPFGRKIRRHIFERGWKRENWASERNGTGSDTTTTTTMTTTTTTTMKTKTMPQRWNLIFDGWSKNKRKNLQRCRHRRWRLQQHRRQWQQLHQYRQ